MNGGSPPARRSRFRAVGQPGQSTPLKVKVTTINDPTGKKLSIARINGLVEIVGPEGALPGDCDGDGNLSEPCALQMSVQLVPQRLALDVDSDGAVTSRNSAITLQKAVGRA